MGQVLHGSATTTAAVCRAIQHSQESLRALAKRYGVYQKTVAKWKGRTSVADLPTGLNTGRSGIVCGAIVTPMEGAYGDQERHPGRFAGGA